MPGIVFWQLEDHEVREGWRSGDSIGTHYGVLAILFGSNKWTARLLTTGFRVLSSSNIKGKFIVDPQFPKSGGGSRIAAKANHSGYLLKHLREALVSRRRRQGHAVGG